MSDKEIIMLLIINTSGVFAGTMYHYSGLIATIVNLVIIIFAGNYLKEAREKAFYEMTSQNFKLKERIRIFGKDLHWIVGYIHNYCIFRGDGPEDRLIKHIEGKIKELGDE